jgi:hypothetical protein
MGQSQTPPDAMSPPRGGACTGHRGVRHYQSWPSEEMAKPLPARRPTLPRQASAPGKVTGQARQTGEWSSRKIVLIYYGAVGDTIKAFTIAGANVSTGSRFQSSNSFAYPGDREYLRLR